MNTISGLPGYNAIYFARLKEDIANADSNAKLINQEEEQITDKLELSFKGTKLTGQTKNKAIASIKNAGVMASMFIGSVALALGNKKKFKEELNTANNEGKYEFSIKEKNENPINSAKNINPKLTEYLAAYKSNDNENIKIPDAAILKIVEINESLGSASALKLANFFLIDTKKNEKSDLSYDKINFAAEYYLENPANVEQCKKELFDETLELIETRAQNSKLFDKIYSNLYNNYFDGIIKTNSNRYDSAEIKEIMAVAEEYPEAVEKLVLNNNVALTIDDIKTLAPLYKHSFKEGYQPKKDEITTGEAIDNLLTTYSKFSKYSKLASVHPGEIVDTYIKHPQGVEYLLAEKRVSDKDFINDTAFLFSKKSYFRGVTDYITDAYRDKNIRPNIVDYTMQIAAIENALSSVDKGLQYRNEKSNYRMDLYKKYGNKQIVNDLNRMIKDERTPKTVDELDEYMYLYRTYPNCKITDKMVEINHNPLSRGFDITQIK